MRDLPILSADDVEQALTRRQAAEAVSRALQAGLEPSGDSERVIVELTSAVRRLARVGNKRQGRLDAEPAAMGDPRTIKETFVPATSVGYRH